MPPRNPALEVVNYTDVYVYKEGLNLISKINNPVVRGRYAEFNSSGSQIINCTAQNTSTWGPGWEYPTITAGAFATGNFSCKNFSSPNQTSKYDFILEWTFDKNTGEIATKIGTWIENYTQVVEFPHPFKSFGTHTADLKIGFFNKS